MHDPATLPNGASDVVDGRADQGVVRREIHPEVKVGETEGDCKPIAGIRQRWEVAIQIIVSCHAIDNLPRSTIFEDECPNRIVSIRVHNLCSMMEREESRAILWSART